MNLLYVWVAERVKDEDWVRFEEELYRPLPGRKMSEREARRIEEEEWAAFHAAAGMFA